MRLHSKSQIHKSITKEQLSYVLSMFEDRIGSFEDTVTLPYKYGLPTLDGKKTYLVKVTAGPIDNEQCALIDVRPELR